jgi:hypothetical protein
MTIRQLRLALTGFGTPPTTAETEIGALGRGERLRRAAVAPLIGLAVAIAVLPIPVVHFAVPPAALVGGLIMGMRRLGQRELFVTAHGPCPFCGTEQTLGVNGSAFRLPRSLKCRSCLRLMTLETG